jgi:hypothetical protein
MLEIFVFSSHGSMCQVLTKPLMNNYKLSVLYAKSFHFYALILETAIRRKSGFRIRTQSLLSLAHVINSKYKYIYRLTIVCDVTLRTQQH